MAKIAYLLLCHKDPDAVIAQARRLTSQGDFISIHFDRRAHAADFARIRSELQDNPNVAFARERLRCGWGAWSLVAATLAALEAAVEDFPRATHFYLLSGDCMPIKSAAYCHAFLDSAPVDYIEGHDFFESDWIKTGFKEERLIYRHPFNERTQKRLFYLTYEAQKRLGVTRTVPADLRVMIGSQWWCLRRSTVEALLAFCRARRDVMRFFRTTWIPDETFFQTLVRHLVPKAEIRNRTPTFLVFSDYGMPVTFYNDHFDLLLGQEYLFARKISSDAMELKKRLGEVYAEDRTEFAMTGEGRRVHAYLTERGRVGRRFAPRFWERDASLGAGRELMILICKKWHVAKRLAARIQAEAGIPAVGYLFNEVEEGFPDLGGIETTLTKRHRHRRALLRLLMDHFDTDRLVICVDPSDLALIEDFAADRCETRILELECGFSDAYLRGHAARMGLAAPDASDETFARLAPTLRADIAFEHQAIREAGLAAVGQLREGMPPEAWSDAVAKFLAIDAETAGRVLEIPYLFSD
ncbi:Core-2/I-Branching enzyme [Palleronia marisminoris]|uniref:Peptide O-xylosyltransferase n=1 Tax=Palleronia marisminoris TaxID=315423 RepID=A0A1Y5SUB4_9RHOB|nr:DUF5928 domain-containing protein [Palleronia marisminoris]SFG99825.1 Core-2/I-Branching enzyme [Palleronia marisminoris]SLN48697.1 Core-2/I-Branching enzyme [Palleronia marisminoris]